jgi:hypothetical protein
VLYKASQKGILNKSMLDDISLPRMPKRLRVWTADEMMLFLDAPHHIACGGVTSTLKGNESSSVKRSIRSVRGTCTASWMKERLWCDAAVYVPDALLSSLKAHLECIVLTDDYLPYDLVVCTKNGNWPHPNNFKRAFKVAVEQLGLPKKGRGQRLNF